MASGPTKFMIRQAQKKGKKYNIKPSDLLDLIQFESAFEPGAVSSANAQGLTQFIPGTAQAYDVKYGTSKKAQKTQIRGAAKYLKDLGYGSGSPAEVRKALAGYYGAASPYADQLISQTKFEKYDKGALKAATAARMGKGGKSSDIDTRTLTNKKRVQVAPAMSFEADRRAAALQLIQTEDKGFEDYLAFSEAMKSLKDQPAQFETVTNKREKIVGGGAKGGKDVQQAFGTKVKGGKVSAVSLGKLAQEMGLSVGEHPKFGGVDPVHTTGSYHYSARAIDVSGDVAKMRKFARRVAKLYGPKLAELFWNGPGATNVDNGERVPKGFVDGHTDHVHVAV